MKPVTARNKIFLLALTAMTLLYACSYQLVHPLSHIKKQSALTNPLSLHAHGKHEHALHAHTHVHNLIDIRTFTGVSDTQDTHSHFCWQCVLADFSLLLPFILLLLGQKGLFAKQSKTQHIYHAEPLFSLPLIRAPPRVFAV